MQQIIEQLRAAMTGRVEADIEGAAAQLEDLVFYLQDA